ncbi:head GIN domain-containing protein [Flavobacterium sp.]|uniref:head GIN domain-containing protein n=1 Tax=Flavobacterium sp. TaxID=239 RepID=UPI00286A58D7|nr:head GIN domain-containing protein [Flavobacterium sp.]
MNKIGFLLVLLATKFLFAQEKNVGDFNKVTSFDQIDVMLIPSQENKVILNGSGSEDVELINKNGELKIRMPLTKLLKGDDVSATVYYTKIDAVEANEGSRIASESAIEATDFDIITKEGSIIDLDLDVEDLHLKMSDGSKVNLEGKATNQDVVINSGSIYKAQKLKTKQTTITANTGAEGFVNASDLVDAKVRAGGKISIYGKPKQVDRKVIAGGKIYEKEE